MEEKLCVFCKHFDMDLGEDYYSCQTPGSPGHIECNKGHWDIDSDNPVARFMFRQNIKIAELCNEYELVVDK